MNFAGFIIATPLVLGSCTSTPDEPLIQRLTGTVSKVENVETYIGGNKWFFEEHFVSTIATQNGPEEFYGLCNDKEEPSITSVTVTLKSTELYYHYGADRSKDNAYPQRSIIHCAPVTVNDMKDTQ